MKNSRSRATALAQLALCSALSGLALFAEAQTAAGESDAELGPGDTISVTVFRNPDLSTEARITPEGTIAFPLVGSVPVAGRTVTGAADAIERALREGDFVRNPEVSVAVLEIRSRRVSVLGHVQRPGQYPLDGTALRVTDALALAGGVTESGDNTVVVMTDRNGTSERIEVDVPGMYRAGDLSADIELASGDTVFVPSAPVFYVYGAVQRAGAYRLESDTPVQHALSLSGGLTPRGSERGIRIHRRMPDGSLQVLDADADDEVLANDVIHVKESIF